MRQFRPGLPPPTAVLVGAPGIDWRFGVAEVLPLGFGRSDCLDQVFTAHADEWLGVVAMSDAFAGRRPVPASAEVALQVALWRNAGKPPRIPDCGIYFVDIH